MVETPGTAPGSTTIIPRAVYRHSQVREHDGDSDIGAVASPCKAGISEAQPGKGRLGKPRSAC